MGKKHTEGMQASLEELLKICEEFSTSEIPMVDNGDFEFVANLFFEMHTEYLRAATDLLHTRRFVPARILGRVMFEGMVLLLWINADRKDRAMKWRAWAAVTDWRLLREKEAAGATIDSAQRQRVLDRAEGVRHLFGRPNPKNDDPFKYNWIPSLPDMIDALPSNALQLKGLYQPIYKLDSQLVHWTVAGIGSLLESENSRLFLRLDRSSEQVRAMNAVFHAAWHVIFNCGRWFGKGLDERLTTIADIYVANGRELMKVD